MVATDEDDEDSTQLAHPFLKWAGGKGAIAQRIASLFPADVRERPYREPFLGGGAMFFYLRPEEAHLSDTLADLITAYQAVQTSVEPLIKRLEKLRETHSSEQYYELRARFNAERDAPALDRASWLIYLNKTCFNGLFRTNRDGQFNVPVGRFANPRIVDPDKIRVSAAALGNAEIRHATFDHLLDEAQPGDFIYLDPPYVPLSKTSSFSAYADGGFGAEDQARLARTFRELDERGCLLALSNSDTPIVRDLYAGFEVTPIVAPRAISARGSARGETTELLVRNLAKYRKA
jgi:DNA adenine methylase